MAIATVITLWTPVEILGRNDILTEIWVAPLEHQTEMFTILGVFIAVTAFIIVKNNKKRNLQVEA